MSHAQNYKFIWKWSRNKLVIITSNTIIGDWDMDIENWAMREYNDIMEDDPMQITVELTSVHGLVVKK